MRKAFFFLISFLLSVMIILFNACKRELSQNPFNKEIIAKVNSWLDLQKPVKQPNQSANVELLKNNLDFSNCRFEQLNKEERFLIIPVLANFSTTKNIDKNFALSLLLVVDKIGNIKRGNLVLYVPEAGLVTKQIPVGTFNEIYNNKTVEANGMFRFLNVSGRWLYQYHYKGGKLHSFGYIRQDENSNNSNTSRTERSNALCIDWFLVTVYYDNGVPVYTEREWVGRTCYGCDDPEIMSLCPMDYEGGSGDQTNDCCVPDPNTSWLPESISEDAGVIDGSEQTDPVTGIITKTKSLQWRFCKNTLLWYVWYLKSFETGTLEKDNNSSPWKFTSLAHDGAIKEGTVPICVDYDFSIGQATPEILNNGASARMTIVFSHSFRINCLPTPQSNETLTSIHNWPAE